jgi:lipopolysaccharide assembly outer membrane protein LptD (OstA)
LTPTFGKSKNLGYFSRFPLYYPFNERSDITFTPIFSAQKKPILIFENRNFRDKSYTRVGGSYADVSVKRRWHADFLTEHRINKHTRFIFKVRRASDITYLLGYPIEKNVSAILPYQQKNLTSQIFWERWKNKNYTTVSGYLFQTEKQSLTPKVLPYIQHDYHNHYGSFSWGSETSFTFLERSHDSNRYQRLRGDLYVQHLGLYKGNVFENTIAAKWDAYHLNRTDESKFLTSPQFQSSWSHPLTCLNFTVEPTAQLTLQDTQQGFVDGLQQEEFDTINIFRRHRMRSYDRMEKKGRVVTGLRQTFFHTNNQITQLFLGKSFPLKHGARDYVSEIKTGTSLWNISHKNAFYRHGFRYSETGIHIGQKWELSLAHIFVNRFMRPINQGQWQIKIPLKPQWNVSLAQIHQLGPRQFVGEKRELSQFLSLDYHDECLKARVGFYHSQYRDKDIKPNSGFLFSLVFNNLGSYDVVSGVSYSESPYHTKDKKLIELQAKLCYDLIIAN